jgi:hypothetical protein
MWHQVGHKYILNILMFKNLQTVNSPQEYTILILTVEFDYAATQQSPPRNWVYLQAPSTSGWKHGTFLVHPACQELAEYVWLAVGGSEITLFIMRNTYQLSLFTQPQKEIYRFCNLQLLV